MKTVTEEQLQAIEKRHADDIRMLDDNSITKSDYDDWQSVRDIRDLQQALRERDATIAALSEDEQVRFGELLAEREELIEARNERDATITELRHRLDDARAVSDRWANECSKEVAEKHALQSQLAELRNSALSYQLQRDMANALVQKQEQMLAELRKPVAVERNEVVEQIRSELWLTIEISHYTVERLIDQYDSVAERLADRVRMLGFVQDQLTSRNKENEELKERERRLRISTERLCDCANALADEHGSLLCFDSMHKRIADARAALAQPTEPNNV
jgi:predicted nuclease with TOPRIM domain